MLTQTVFCMAVGYFSGSVMSAIVVCRLLHLPDPREQHSGNPGATNALRVGGKRVAIMTLLGDMLKGMLPIGVARWFDLPDLALSLVALAILLGHLFPCFFQGKGGKGVATGLGSLLVLSWVSGVILLLLWIGSVLLFRYVSLGSVLCALVSPILVAWQVGGLSSLPVFLMGILVVWRHRANIQRLWAGREPALRGL